MPVEAQPGRTLGRYVVESAIGAGGFATVFRAVDTVLGRPVALKVLDPVAQRDATVARRFLREGRAVASLDHHAIVPVYDAGEDDGLLWLAMRLIEGRSLAEVLDGGRRPTGDEVVALVDRIGPALDHAHGQGVVHRDVKPSNILLESGDPARAWLADFGIAATARTARRYTTGMLGTAAYMAPEQARPHEVGPPADVYSLGCVVFELVTGRRPFPGDDHVALLMAHATLRVPPTGDARLDRVLARALAKDPAARPPSGAALAGELRAAVAAGRHAPAPSGPEAVFDDAATARSAPTLVAPGTRRIPPPPPPRGRAAPTAAAAPGASVGAAPRPDGVAPGTQPGGPQPRPRHHRPLAGGRRPAGGLARPQRRGRRRAPVRRGGRVLHGARRLVGRRRAAGPGRPRARRGRRGRVPPPGGAGRRPGRGGRRRPGVR
jgi:serine/threonine-protein kinase